MERVAGHVVAETVPPSWTRTTTAPGWVRSVTDERGTSWSRLRAPPFVSQSNTPSEVRTCAPKALVGHLRWSSHGKERTDMPELLQTSVPLYDLTSSPRRIPAAYVADGTILDVVTRW
jgi:hypothetical protein